MPTYFITGKKGGGKTLKAMREIERELRNTRRTVITNFPIIYTRFREYLMEKYGDDFDYKNRMVMISTEQTAHFWLYYALESVEFIDFDQMSAAEQAKELVRAEKEKRLVEGKVITHAKKITGRRESFEANDGDTEKGKKGTKQYVPDYSCRDGHPSVCYYIDEVHLTFSSRKWTKTGDDCLHYITLERHFGDDQYLCTQCFGNVDKQMREMGQEFIVCTNQKKMPVPGTFGLVGRPGAFTAAHYADPPTKGEQTALTVYTFGLDKEGIASCYRTVAGAEFGVGDDSADKGVSQRGKIPFWVLVVGCLVALGVGIFAVNKAATWFISRGATGVSAKARQAYGLDEAKASGASVTEGHKPVVVRPVERQEKVERPVSSMLKDDVEEPVYMVGAWAMDKSKGLTFALSDGRTLSQADPDHKGVVRGVGGMVVGVMAGGKVYRFPPPGYKQGKPKL